MSISGIGNSSSAVISTKDSVKYSKQKKEKPESTSTEAAKDIQDIYTPSGAVDKGEVTPKNKTYTVNMAEINRIKAEVNRRTEDLRSIVEKLITKQGHTVNEVLKALEDGKEIKISIDPETQAQAQAEISEDGFWGVKQTSERIVEFAKQLSGGDPEKINAMKDAFEKGFRDAEKAFGGKLPEISYQTYDAVMKGFEDWEGESKAVESEAGK